MPTNTQTHETAPRFGNKQEHAVIRALIRHLKGHGFLPHSVVHDERVMTKNETTALQEVFEVDESTLCFRFASDTNPKPRLFGVLLICGNGVDIVSDWSAPVLSTHPWNAAMSSFDAEDIYK